MLAAAILIAFFGSLILTGAVRRYALAKDILDHPNVRSSHTRPTPRGGGMAIVVVVLLLVVALDMVEKWEFSKVAALFTGGLLVAAVGFWDDLGGLSAKWRFLAHLVASGIAVAAFGAIQWIPFGAMRLPLGWLGIPVSVMMITWFINSTNFMDGIDGIAGSEVAFVAAATGWLAYWDDYRSLAALGWVLAAACIGFLCWNWPPAKIFMGDVGSGFLGFLVGAFLLDGFSQRPMDFWALLILPGVFTVDAAITLLRRVVTGRRWYEAHRSHAYQHAAQRWGHLKVTLTLLLLNVGWILPISCLARQYPEMGWWMLLAAWFPVAGLVLWQRAGMESQV